MPVLDLSAGDQTLTVTGDTGLLEVYAALPPGLMPPFPPLELPGGVGGLVERGGFGQNFFFGAEVLGVVFRAHSGRLVRAGGRTVKNVQGYDLTRPFVGSFGVLGEAQEVTLRLRPGPSVGHVSAPGRLGAMPALHARFAWEVAGQIHLLHFGHEREVARALAEVPGAAPVTALPDLLPLFTGGMGAVPTDTDAPVRDRRFGWVSGTQRPEVPALFGALAAAL